MYFGYETRIKTIRDGVEVREMDTSFWIDSYELAHEGWAIRLHVDAEFTDRTYHINSIESHEPKASYEFKNLPLEDRVRIEREIMEQRAEYIRDRDWGGGGYAG